MTKLISVVLAGLFLSAAIAGCTTPVDPDTMSEEMTQVDVQHITEAQLLALPDGEKMIVDITSLDVGYEITYTNISVLERVLVRSVEGEYLLSDKAAELGITSSGAPSRFVLARDPDLQQDILAGAEPSPTPQAIYVCDECHVHSGGIIHCTGCVKIAN